MRRIPILLLLALSLLTACSRSLPVKPVVAVLLSDDVRLAKVDGLRAGLAGFGYGPEALEIRVFSAKGDRTVLNDLAEKALASHPALLVAGGGVEALALKESTARQKTPPPIVLMGVASTVRTGLVASLMHPGGNITGLDNQHAELSGKRLELLTKLLPGISRVLLLYDPLVEPSLHALEVTTGAATQLNLRVGTLPASSRDEVTAGLARLQPGQYDAALLLPGYVLEEGAQFAPQFLRLHLPVMGLLDMEGKGGLLAAYGVTFRDQGMQSAHFVAKLLQGAKPAAIPVETPDNPTLMVDLRVARQFGITPSPVGMALANTVLTATGDQP